MLRTGAFTLSAANAVRCLSFPGNCRLVIGYGLRQLPVTQPFVHGGKNLRNGNIFQASLRTVTAGRAWDSGRFSKDAQDISGWYPWSSFLTAAGGFAREPPLTGSITTMDLPYFLAIS